MSNLFDQIEQRVEATMREMGERMVEQAREQLNTPYPPASEPSEIPRKRSGRLQREIEVDIVADDGDVTLTLDSKAPYTKSLEDRNRTIFGNLAEEFTPIVKAALSNAVNSSS